jgi:hypothetical protein
MTAAADKVCSRCSESKPAAAFYKNKRSGDGLASECRECAADRQRERAARVRNMPPVEVDLRRTFYLLAEAANILEDSERTTTRRIDSGELVAPERGRGKPIKITARSLHALLERMGA